jgi:hypothetical protein
VTLESAILAAAAMALEECVLAEEGLEELRYIPWTCEERVEDAFATPRTSPPMSVRSAAYSRDAIHPFRQQRTSILVQSTCNTTKLPKVRRHLEEKTIGCA